MTDTIDKQKQTAAEWFKTLRDQICASYEAVEQDCEGGNKADLHPAKFERKTWQREGGGGGEMSIIRGGRVFEKVGINISTVHGQFSEEFREKIPGAQENNGEFWASGISLVAHMQSPLVPAVHMNTRMIVTSQQWFGGGADLTPMFPNNQDTSTFHNALKECCDRHNKNYYPQYKEWCDRYFYLPHREEPRGIGGIFFDNLNTGNWHNDFAFTQDVGETFRDLYPQIAREHMNKNWSEEEREYQLEKRGRYVEFNLLYDRGTTFGLKTGGNTEAILMSLPPEVKWK